MDNYLNEMNFIDLISEKHKKLRREVMKLWLLKNGEEVSDTESHMLGVLDKKPMTVAESARKMNISRQAAHKCSKKLIDHGYIVMNSIEGNKRDKLLILTNKGEEYCNEMLKIKEKIEEDISKKIGKETIEILKTCLRKDWI